MAERLLFHRPTDIDICKELASIYLEQNYPQRALPKLHLCYKSRPRDTEVLTILSSVFEQLHQTHKAVVTLKELARIYEESGLRNERDDALMSVLKLDSGDQEAKAALSSQKPLPKKSQMDSEIIFDEEAFLAKSPAPPVPPSLPTMGASENVSSDQDDEIGFDDSDGEEEVVVQPMSEIDIPISIEEESRELEELPVEFVAPPEMPPIHPEIPLEATAGENDGFSDATLDEPIITAVEEPEDEIEIPLEEPVSAGTTGSDSLSSPETSPETPPAPPEAPVDAPASSEHVEEAPVAQNAISAIPMGPESTETSVEKTEALDAETVPAPPKLEAEDNEGRQEEETGTQPAKLSEEEEAALQGELQELEFFLEVGLDSEAQSLLNELLTRYPGHPDLVAHSANHQKDGSKGSNS